MVIRRLYQCRTGGTTLYQVVPRTSGQNKPWCNKQFAQCAATNVLACSALGRYCVVMCSNVERYGLQSTQEGSGLSTRSKLALVEKTVPINGQVVVQSPSRCELNGVVQGIPDLQTGHRA